jgi:hypothetical protein
MELTKQTPNLLIFQYKTLNTKNVFKNAREVLYIIVCMPHRSKAQNFYPMSKCAPGHNGQQHNKNYEF